MVGDTVADVWEPADHGRPMAFYSLFAVAVTGAGPHRAEVLFFSHWIAFVLGIMYSMFEWQILVSAKNNSAPSNATQILNPASWGAAVAVVRMDGDGGWLIETKGYGTAKADGTKNSSQLFTVFAAGLLISNETLNPQISWTTKIASIIPDWELIDPVATSQSTISDLMSHRTGLPAHNFGAFLFNDTISSMLQRMKYLKPSTGFREDIQYNNIPYAILSHLPTALLPNEPTFVQYVTDNIITPLGLNSTTYSFAAANATGAMADGFAREAINITENPLGKGTYTRILPYLFPDESFDETTAGEGGVITTVIDAARWLQMLLLNGQHPDTSATIIPAAVVQKAATGLEIWAGNSDAGQLPGVPELGPAVYGGGQAQTSYRGHIMIEHEGDLPGYHSRITRFPPDGVGIAIFTNDDDFGPYIKEVLKFRIADEIFGLDPVDWNSRYQNAAAEVEQEYADLTSTTAPVNASLPFNLSIVEGTYRNLGYGADIELCATSTANPQSPNCTSLIAQLNSSFPIQLAAADLVWAWYRVLAGYGALKHFDGTLFNLTAWVPMPPGDPSAPLWPYDSRLGGNVAEFVLNSTTVTGFGIRGVFGELATSQESRRAKLLRKGRRYGILPSDREHLCGSLRDTPSPLSNIPFKRLQLF
ncbi:beta-lactamase/transpeptidase-like protein [Mycena galopus ATCC 62051]|nr:beta-lactamase/transpeptidase-like protein [Mycena galopus ATCC 62051]